MLSKQFCLSHLANHYTYLTYLTLGSFSSIFVFSHNMQWLYYARTTDTRRLNGQGTHYAKMGADSLAENTPNAQEFICSICLPKPKSSGFQWKKASLGVRSPWVITMKNAVKYCWLKVQVGKFKKCLARQVLISMFIHSLLQWVQLRHFLFLLFHTTISCQNSKKGR